MRKGRRSNEQNVSSERPTKTPRFDGEEEVQTQDDIPGQSQLGLGQSEPAASSSIPSYVTMETFGGGMTRISMDFDGEGGRALKKSFIESVCRWSCPTDLDLICSDGVSDVDRFILMGTSNFLFQLLRNRDTAAAAMPLVNVSIVHLSLALELIYTGTANVKESDKDSVLEVLNFLERKLELKEATEEGIAMRVALQQAETAEENGATVENQVENAGASNNNANAHNAIEELDVINNELELGVARSNETETGVVEEIDNRQVFRPGAFSNPPQMELQQYLRTLSPSSILYPLRRFYGIRETEESKAEINVESDYDCDTQVEVDKENDSLPPGNHEDDNETGQDADRTFLSGEDERDHVDQTPGNEEDEDDNMNPMTAAAGGPGQFDLREPYSTETEGHIPLNEKQIHWRWMDALPSLTSPDLRNERMRVFTLSTNFKVECLHTEVQNLFKSLPENSLERRLGVMAVQCENYKEKDLVEIVQPSNRSSVVESKFLKILDVKLVRIPNESANLVRKIKFDEDKMASQQTVALRNEMMKDESDARYNLANYEKIIHENIPINQDRLLEIGNIKGLQGRANAIIKMNAAGRTVTIYRLMSELGWHIDADYTYMVHIEVEIEGIGWGVLKGRSQFNFNVTGTQILFPILVKDVELAKKVLAETQNLNTASYFCQYVALLPKCLPENGISCFPVVQTPGMLIYKHDEVDLKWTSGTSKLRLGMGAEIRL